jgi:4-hydroxybenzoate polyprenyltransferase/chlorophyll synthase
MAYTLLRTEHPAYIYRLAHRSLASLHDVVAEARPAVQLVFMLRAAACAGLLWHPSPRAFVGLSGWLLITVTIYTFNGVTDVTEDTANGSSRPIASGRLPVDIARTWCAALAGVGLVLCGFASPVEASVGAAMLALGWSYSAGPTFKESSFGAAVIIGAMAALSYIAGACAIGNVTVRSLIVPMSIALWVALCCAAKDFSDVDGDRLAGRRTWPVVLGNVGAARRLAVVSIAGAALTLGFALWARSDLLPAIGLAMGSVALSVAVMGLASNRNRRIRRRIYRVFMSTQYLANAMLLVTVP